MPALLIDDAVRRRIKEVIAYAGAHPLPLPAVRRAARDFNEDDPATRPDIMPSFRPEAQVAIPVGYHATFSLEEQPVGLCRHLSVSVSRPGKMPSPTAVELIMEEFGFKNRLLQCKVWMETFNAERQKAINVLEPVSGVWP